MDKIVIVMALILLAGCQSDAEEEAEYLESCGPGSTVTKTIVPGLYRTIECTWVK